MKKIMKVLLVTVIVTLVLTLVGTAAYGAITNDEVKSAIVANHFGYFHAL